jgi:prophage regulatory protein
MNDRLLTERELRKDVPFSHVTIWRKIKSGEFPQPVRIGRSVYFSEREVQKWISDRLASRNEAEQ